MRAEGTKKKKKKEERSLFSILSQCGRRLKLAARQSQTLRSTKRFVCVCVPYVSVPAASREEKKGKQKKGPIL